MNSIPTAEEIIALLIPQKENVSEEENEDSICQNKGILVAWAKLHVEAALEAAARKILFETITYDSTGQDHKIINRSSILNAYSQENIK